MGCFLFQQWGLGTFQSSLPFPRPPPGFDFLISNGNWRTSALARVHQGCVTGRLLQAAGDLHCLWQTSWQLPVTLRMLILHLLLLPGKPCRKKSTPTALLFHCRALDTKLTAGFCPPSLLVSRLHRGKVTECWCALFRWVMMPKDGADTDGAPRNISAAFSPFLFQKI